MPAWQWALDSVGVVFGLLAVYGLALIVRRHLISRAGGTFELSFRARPERAGRGWVLGVGRYTGDTLEWWRIFSLSFRPKHSWRRSELGYAGRRQPDGGERMSLYADHVVVSCSSPEGSLELAMSPSSLTGFQAWLEAGPPGAAMNL